MNITLHSEPNNLGTKYSFDPSGNAVIMYTGGKVVNLTTTPKDQIDLNAKVESIVVKSITNDTDYIVLLSSDQNGVLEALFGSIADTKLDQPVTFVRAIKKPLSQCETKNTDNTDKNTTTYKITMIVFIVLFAVMFIGLLILYFTGISKFQSFGHGAHY